MQKPEHSWEDKLTTLTVTYKKPSHDSIINYIQQQSKTNSLKQKLKTLLIGGMGLAATVAVIIFVLNLPHFLLDEAPTSVESPKQLIVSDQEIKSKVDSTKEKLKIGLTQEQVKNILGTSFYIGHDYGDLANGNDEIWRYDYFKKDGYHTAGPVYAIDERELTQRNVGAFVLIFWKEKRVIEASIVYVQGHDNKHYMYRLNPDGSTTEEIVASGFQPND